VSCSPGEIAHEDPYLGHGVFMHFVVQGLSGEADADNNAVVTFGELSRYVNEQTKLYVRERLHDSQRPFLLLFGTPDLLELPLCKAVPRLLNPEWIDRMVAEAGVDEVIDRHYRDATGEAALVRSALDLSRHILREHPEQCTFQLQARLVGWMDKYPVLHAFDNVKPINGIRLIAKWPSLDQPGGPLLRTLRGHSHDVTCVAISPDGRLAVSGSRDKTLKVWDLSSGRELRTLKSQEPVTEVSARKT